MRLEKGLPRRSRSPTLRRRFDTMVIEDTLNRIPVHDDPDIVQGVPNTSLTPRLILVRHFYDKISYARGVKKLMRGGNGGQIEISTPT